MGRHIGYNSVNTIQASGFILILNSEWSPETTLQAEDRCHRPGQTKDVYVHYYLHLNSMDVEMWGLINAKREAQVAIFDKVATFQTVEDVVAQAANANAQLKVAKALLQVQREPLPAAIIPAPQVEISLSETNITPAPSVSGQLSILDLLEMKPEVMPKQKRRKRIVPEQQISFFDVLYVSAD